MPDIASPLANGDYVEVDVRYTPSQPNGNEGTLEARYEYLNEEGEVIAGDENLVPVPIFGRRPTPQISVSPESVIFDPVDEGAQSEPETLYISNVGIRPLEISSIAFSLLDADDNDQFELRNLPDLSNGPIVIEPEDYITIDLVYNPTEAANHAATLQIRSNSAEDGTKLVQVTGRVKRPCIEVIPGEINLGIVALNIESQRSNAQITNCGDLPVEVSDIQVTGSDTGFQWSPVEEAWNGTPPFPHWARILLKYGTTTKISVKVKLRTPNSESRIIRRISRISKYLYRSSEAAPQLATYSFYQVELISDWLHEAQRNTAGGNLEPRYGVLRSTATRNCTCS